MAKTIAKPVEVVITEQMVDELAQVRDQLRALTAREKHLKEIFRKGGEAVYRGRATQVSIKFTTERRMDVTAARAALGEEWVADHLVDVEKMNITQMDLV
jgi:hypothetical protein